MLEMTVNRQRLTQCRTKTLFTFADYNANKVNKDTWHTFLLTDAEGREWLWSGNDRYPDAMNNVNKLVAAIKAAYLPEGATARNGHAQVWIRSWPDGTKAWEHFHFQAVTQPLLPPEVDCITDLFG